ncbi:hypothetical protein ASG72_04350 [Bosea sp. Leaf344]|uniref:cobalamin biosynthesis protein n=1 Tax=Bosea sp. Leaf344 TaxID=1736346 RepID=UPI0006FEFED5|nr:cobalamin biosynthesis protein [Bosea sp. Leaf344]KQU54846.1 hypothetical protein ASG72_04350 [Bosea sp. Leaf344]
MSGELIAGIGLRPDTPEQDIAECLAQALALAGLEAGALARIATLQARIGEPGLAAVAAACGCPVTAIPDEALQGFEAGCATRSTRISALYGVGSVAEAAALAAAGPGGRLVQPRIATARVTCALARSAP